MKRIIYLLTIIGVIAIVVGVFYFLRYRAEEPEEPTPPAPGGLPPTPPQTLEPPATPEEPASANGEEQVLEVPKAPGEVKFGVVAHNEVLSYFVDDQNNAIIVQPDGQIVKIVRGESSVLSSSAILNLMEAKFSYDGKRILATFGNRSSLQHSVFNIETKSWRPLSVDIKSTAWSPTNYRIAYSGKQNGRMTLATLDLEEEKSAPQEIMRMGAEDVDIFWLAPNQLILSDKPSALYAGSLLSVDTARKTVAVIAAEQLGLDSGWSRAAEMGVVFRTDLSRRGGRLSLFDVAGNILNDLSFLTLPSKCAFAVEDESATSTASQKFLYCAVPRNQEELTARTLPDEYAKRSFFTQDNFYQIDLTNGSIGEILAGELVDGDQLKAFGGNLFFINRLNKKLYAISLE